MAVNGLLTSQVLNSDGNPIDPSEESVICDGCLEPKDASICTKYNGFNLCPNCLEEEKAGVPFSEMPVVVNDSYPTYACDAKSCDRPWFPPSDEYPDRVESAGPDSHRLFMSAFP